MSVSQGDVGIHEFIRQGNALMSYYLCVAHPERLDDEAWVEKWRQIEWLAEKEIIGKK